MFLHTFLLFLLSLSLLFLQTSLLCHLYFSSDIFSLAFFRHLVSVLCTLPRTFLSFEHFFWYLFSVLWTLLWTSLLCPLHSSSDISPVLCTCFRRFFCPLYTSSDLTSVFHTLLQIPLLSFAFCSKYLFYPLWSSSNMHQPHRMDHAMWSF